MVWVRTRLKVQPFNHCGITSTDLDDINPEKASDDPGLEVCLKMKDTSGMFTPESF